MLLHKNTISWDLAIRRAFGARCILQQQASNSLRSARVWAASRKGAKITAKTPTQNFLPSNNSARAAGFGCQCWGTRSPERQSWYLLCCNADSGGSKRSFCLWAHSALSYLGVRALWSSNLWFILQVEFIVGQVGRLPVRKWVRKWVFSVHWVLTIYIFLAVTKFAEKACCCVGPPDLPASFSDYSKPWMLKTKISCS